MVERAFGWRGFALAAALLVGLPAVSAVAQQAAAPDFGDVQLTGEYGPHLPPNIGKHEYAAKADLLINVLHVFMIALFVAWGAFFLYCIFKFRARTGHKADVYPVKAKVSKYAELGVAIFEGVLLLGISIPAWASVKNEAPGPEKKPLRVRVVAEQFAWNFHYPGPDGVFGKVDPNEIDLASNPVGIVKSDSAGSDDFSAVELHIPENRPVIVEITSKDVIHSFFIPVMRVKQDAIPGMRIPIWFEAKEGSAGTYEIQCAQLCGNNHYSMKALMKVYNQEEYEAWYAEASKGPEVFDPDEFD